MAERRLGESLPARRAWRCACKSPLRDLCPQGIRPSRLVSPAWGALGRGFLKVREWKESAVVLATTEIEFQLRWRAEGFGWGGVTGTSRVAVTPARGNAAFRPDFTLK